METKQDLIQYCLTYKDVYEDYPFRDHEWAVIRHRKNKKVFAWIRVLEISTTIPVLVMVATACRKIPNSCWLTMLTCRKT